MVTKSIKLKYFGKITKDIIAFAVLTLLLLANFTTITIANKDIYLDDLLISSNNKELKDWTFLAYLNGDQTTHLQNSTIGYINQLENIETNSNVNIIVQADFYDMYEGKTIRYNISHDTDANNLADYENNVNMWEVGEKHMNDPETLTDFVNWTADNYEADRYCLFILGYGSGWRGRLLRDPTTMSLDEFKSSLQTINSRLNKEIDILIMMPCYSGMMEVCYHIKNYVKYYIASEGQSNFDCLSLKSTVDIIKDHSSETSEKITRKIVNNPNPSLNSDSYCLVGMDFNKIDDAVSAVKSLADIGNENINKILGKNKVKNALNHPVHASQTTIGAVDLLSIVEDFRSSFPEKTTKCDEIEIKIKDFLMIPECGLYMSWKGISIFAPSNKNKFDELKEEYNQLNFADGKWYSFLNNYFQSFSNVDENKNINPLLKYFINQDYFQVIYNVFRNFRVLLY